MSSGFLIHIEKNRTHIFTANLLKADGSAYTDLAADDVVRFKIGRNTSTPALDLSSIAATANGSIITFTPGSNVVTVRLAQGDTASIEAGAYDAEFAIVDNSETSPPNAIKHAESGVIFIHPTQAGEVGDEESSSSSSSSG